MFCADIILQSEDFELRNEAHTSDSIHGHLNIHLFNVHGDPWNKIQKKSRCLLHEQNVAGVSLKRAAKNVFSPAEKQADWASFRGGGNGEDVEFDKVDNALLLQNGRSKQRQIQQFLRTPPYEASPSPLIPTTKHDGKRTTHSLAEQVTARKLVIGTRDDLRLWNRVHKLHN